MRLWIVSVLLFACVYALMADLGEQTFPEPTPPVAARQRGSYGPSDPVTGVKLNWITYLYRHTEDYQARHRR